VAQALGLGVLRCDPPRARAEGVEGFVGLDEVVEGSDVVTLHVPLVKEGPDRTLGLLDAGRLAQMKPSAWLLNAARGDVVELGAWGARLGAVDVWPGEPKVSAGDVAKVTLASAHIAGHSLEAKVAGTEAVYRAACGFLGVEATWEAAAVMPPLPSPARIEARGRAWGEVMLEAARASYQIERDDEALRGIVALGSGDEVGAAFQRFRNAYPVRREFWATPLELRGASADVEAALRALGFPLV
jgi:erythronate-4-phosphate dehydrogenase